MLDQPARLSIVVGGDPSPVRLRVDDTDLDTSTTPRLPAGRHTIRVTATGPMLLSGLAVTPVP